MTQADFRHWVYDLDTGERLYPAFAGGVSIGGGGSKQKSKSKSSSGVDKDDRGMATQELFSLIEQILLPQIQQYRDSAPQIAVNSVTGMTPQQTNMARSMVDTGIRQQFNKLSGGGAMKGQLSPKNTSALVGSSTERAVESVMPQFATMAQENLKFNTTSQQNTMGNAAGFMQNLAGLLLGLTQGSEGMQSGSGNSFNFNAAYQPT